METNEKIEAIKPGKIIEAECVLRPTNFLKMVFLAVLNKAKPNIGNPEEATDTGPEAKTKN